MFIKFLRKNGTHGRGSQAYVLFGRKNDWLIKEASGLMVALCHDYGGHVAEVRSKHSLSYTVLIMHFSVCNLVFTCWDYRNQAPQIRWGKTKLPCHTLEVRSPNSRCQQGCFLLTSVAQDLFQGSLLALRGLLAVIHIPWLVSASVQSFQLHGISSLHIAFTLCVSVFKFPLLVRTLIILGLGPTKMTSF